MFGFIKDERFTCLGRGMFGMWDIWVMGCWGCGMLGWGMFKMRDVRDVRCLGCGMLGM